MKPYKDWVYIVMLCVIVCLYVVWHDSRKSHAAGRLFACLLDLAFYETISTGLQKALRFSYWFWPWLAAAIDSFWLGVEKHLAIGTNPGGYYRR